MPTNEELLRSSMAQNMLSAGVPMEEVLAGLQQSMASASIASAGNASAPAIPTLPTRQLSGAVAYPTLAPLPEGWEERFDPASGRKFYVDYKNKTTSWTRPQAMGSTSPRQSFSNTNWSLPDVSADAVGGQPFAYPTLTPRAGGSDTAASAAARESEEGVAAVAAAEAAEAAAAAADASDAAAAVAAADAADAAEAKKQGGFFGKMFGKKKEKERPNATPPAAAPPAPAPVPTTVDGCVQALAGSGDAAQKRAAAEKLRELCASSTAELAEGDRPLVLVEALGGAADPPMQATLCMLLAQLAGGAADGALAGRLADGGALFYLASLLASPSAEVAQEATLLLTAMCATSEAVRTQLVDVANGLPPLLALLSNASPPLPSLVLALLDSLVAAGAARALRDAGAAEPLARSLVAAASEAKGWGGGGATGEGEARAATLLGILDAMANVDVQAVQDGMRAASATPSLVALLGAADEGLRGKASGMLNRLVPADGAGSGEMVASGGLVMLCDALANGTSEANRKQALQTVAKLSSSAQNAVAIAENAGTVGALHHFLGDADGAAAGGARASPT